MNLVKRLAVFVGYDKDSIIHDYVVYYLSELSKSADIIYVADNDLSQCGIDKIKPYTIKIIAQRHGEYDFGSYKRGYLFAKQSGILDEYDFLIFCNDSVFGPFYSFDKIFAEIPQRQDIVYGFSKHLEADCDWGGVEHKFIEEHLQSYFVVMPKSVFLSDWYSDFIKSIKKEIDKVEVVFKYEIGMSILFRQRNIKLLSHYENAVDISHLKPLEVIKKYNGIFLKRKTFFVLSFRDICEIFNLINHRAITNDWCYDTNLIVDYYERNGQELVLAYRNDIIKHKRLNKKIAKITKYIIPLKALRKWLLGRYIVLD